MKRENVLFGLSLIAAVGALAIASGGRTLGATIAQWDFENPPNPIAVNNSPAPTIGVGTASSIGMNLYPTPNVGVTTDDVLVGVNYKF